MKEGNVNELIAVKTDSRYIGCADAAVRFLTREQLCDTALWKKFVLPFREHPDGENFGWRGEFWGKMMRGAALVYAYSADPALYDAMTETVRDMLACAEPDGRVSSYSRESEFDAWDIWCRKYVLLGLEYYLDACKDETLKCEILAFLCRCADCILEKIGDGEGQKAITAASRSWRGVNSSSILEPIVRLYRLTNEKKYLDFATYIVKNGGADGINIFELAYENKLFPYQYGVSKAYEMISCFEGLLEYYEVTGVERYKTAAVNFGKAIVESDVTVIGSLGCTHELLDHSKARQTARYDGVMQETCVTVTWMKYCARLLRLTGERLFADCIEQSFYNAYLGSLNIERRHSDYIIEKYVKKLGVSNVIETFLPFDSYSPLTPGLRGQKVGGNQLLSDHSYYGCCACIGAAGVGVLLENAILCDRDGLVINFFENGTVNCNFGGKVIQLTVRTDYPVDGEVSITAESDIPTDLTLKLRIPAWSQNTKVISSLSHTISNGFAVIKSARCTKMSVELGLDMSVRTQAPAAWDHDVIYTDMSTSTAPLIVPAPCGCNTLRRMALIFRLQKVP